MASLVRAAGQPQLDGRGVEQVAAADDEVDAVALVVDDHAEAVRPVAHAVARHEVAGRRGLVGHRPRQQVDPALRARPDRHPQARAVVLGELPLPAAARDSRSRATAGPASASYAANVERLQVQRVDEARRRAAGRARPRSVSASDWR